MHKDLTLPKFEDGKAPNIRKEIAEMIYKEHPNGVIAVRKGPRAGATVGFVSAAIDRKERILILEPNGNISTETVVRLAPKYSKNPDAEIVVVPSNHECLKNKKLCEDYLDVSRLPILPLPDKCDDCEEYNECPVTAIVRKKDTLSGASITYHKFAALQLAPQGKKGDESPSFPKQVLDVLRGFHTIVMDEAMY